MKAMTIPNTVSMLNDPNIFIGDSGASTHSTQHGQGLVHIHKGKDNDLVMIGSGNLMKASVVGNLPGTICNKYGEAIRRGIMQHATHCPSIQCNIFSLTELLLEGWELGGDKESIWLKKGKSKIEFDIKLITQKGIIFCIYFKRTLSVTGISATIARINNGKAHDILGHCNRRVTIETTEALNWVITGVESNPCMHCTAVKIKKKTLDRTGNPNTRESNGRIGIDINIIKPSRKPEITVSMLNWLRVIDERSGVNLSFFHKNKDYIVAYLAEKFSRFKYDGSLVLR